MKFFRIVQQFCKLAFIMKLNIVNLMEMVEVLVSLFGYIGMEAYYREENIFPSECLPERGGSSLAGRIQVLIEICYCISLSRALYIIIYV